MSRDLLTSLDSSIEQRASRMIRLRRRIHATPEPSGEEVNTSNLVAETLCELGLEPRLMENGVGVLADIDLGGDRDTFIALRADLDSVRVNDEKQAGYASTQPGLCHACGHDAHTAMLLAASGSLWQQRERLNGEKPRHNIRLIFQPAEETATGARSMIQQHALDKVVCILAQHVEPFLEVGTIGVRYGPLTAACKQFKAVIRGRGGHAARPSEGVDPIPAATSLIDQFYRLLPRCVDSHDPSVVTVANINAGDAYNAIPDRVTLGGTMRTISAETMGTIHQRMETIARGVAEATGCDIHLEFGGYCPPTDNDRELVDVVVKQAHAMLGADAVTWIPRPSMGGEDFAFYQELIPGAMIRLGVALPAKTSRRPLHSSLFDLDEDALAIGAKLIARAGLALALGYTRAEST